MEAAGNVPIQGGGHREENEDTLAQHVPTSQSYADILAGMNTGAAATLAIPIDGRAWRHYAFTIPVLV